MEIEEFDGNVTMALCEELAAFITAHDERRAATPHELRDGWHTYTSEERMWMLRQDGALRGAVQVGFLRGDEQRRRAFVSVRWLDDVDPTVVVQLLRDGLAWAGCPEHAEALAWEYEDRPEVVALLREVGFEQIGLERFLARDLVALPLPPLIDVPGIEVATLEQRPDLVEQAHAVWRQGILDIPGEEDAVLPSYEAWCEAGRTSHASPFAQRRVAIEDGEVVGYCSLQFPPARPHVAQHGLLAIRPDRRGTGLGRMFKHHAIRTAAEAGCTVLETDNDSRNAPILHLNRSLGFEPIPSMVKMRRQRAE